MEEQKRRERIKEYEKQEKRIRDLKASGQSKKKAEAKSKEALTRKQMKNRTKLEKNDDEAGPTELLERPKEYIVKFRFPETSALQPPILGLHDASFNYPGQAPLFKKVDFGIDMESRIAIVGKLGYLEAKIRNQLFGFFCNIMHSFANFNKVINIIKDPME